MRTKLICLLVLCSSPCSLVAAPFAKVIDSPMYKLPALPVPPVEFPFPKGAKELWLRALERPDSDLKCKAAHAIATAHRDGEKGFETTIAPLLAAFDRADQDATVRQAVAQTLIVLDARATAPSLFRRAKSGGGDLRAIVEPALARWNYRPARAVWLSRLRDPATRRGDLILAMRGLAVVREEQAADRLREMSLDARLPGPLRLESARALGAIRTSGLERDAERLAEDASPRALVSRLVAASLLRLHGGADAVRLLQRFARDSEPSVAALAVARLLEIDPDLVVPALEHLLASADAKLRLLAVETLRRRPNEKHIRLLGERLDDANSEVRIEARRRLFELAGDKRFHDPVIAAATAMLMTNKWRGLEQATILLTQLDRKPVAARLVELLTNDRPEVCLTAAWGLRKLDVPDTLDGVWRYVESQVKRSISPEGSPQLQQANDSVVGDHVLSQLNQFLGQRKFRKAGAVLRLFVPKRELGRIGPESRAAAIWALGMILEGETEDALAAALEARLNDISSIPPEDSRVRYMSAIALGRLKAKKAETSLRQFFKDKEASEDLINNACGWAIERITGEAMSPPKTIRKARRDWFLIPQG